MAKQFEFHDYFNLDELLTEEVRIARDSVREWVQHEIVPVIESHAMEGTFDKKWFRQLGELGCFGPSLPVESGGQGMTETGYGVIMRELERGDSSIRSMASVQGSLVMYPIAAFGSEEQKNKWLPRLGQGEKIGCFGLTEPNHGSDPGSMETRLIRKGEGYVLSGQKMWITSASLADVGIIWARLDEKKIQGVLLDMKAPGVRVEDIGGKWSLRASATGVIYMDEVYVEEKDFLPGAKGLRAAFQCLNKARYGIAWGAIGAAMDCFHTAVRYARERHQFGKPLGEFQLVQKKLAEMLTDISAAQLMASRVGQMADAGKVKPSQISMAKRHNVDVALRTARTARDILGAIGITNDYPVMRHMMNLETVSTYEGTHDIHLLITGQDITGLSAFK